MVIWTAKFNKKRAILAVAVLAAALIAIILFAGRRDSGAPRPASLVRNNDERVAFLNSLGWEVEETVLEQQQVLIPKEFGAVYEEYNALQLQQGFDLTKYAGMDAMRYTYRLLNYPDANVSAVADIIVCQNEVIAGDVQSNALDGFMKPLR
jgi:hypothetical protein